MGFELVSPAERKMMEELRKKRQEESLVELIAENARFRKASSARVAASPSLDDKQPMTGKMLSLGLYLMPTADAFERMLDLGILASEISGAAEELHFPELAGLVGADAKRLLVDAQNVIVSQYEVSDEPARASLVETAVLLCRRRSLSTGMEPILIRAYIEQANARKDSAELLSASQLDRLGGGWRTPVIDAERGRFFNLPNSIVRALSMSAQAMRGGADMLAEMSHAAVEDQKRQDRNEAEAEKEACMARAKLIGGTVGAIGGAIVGWRAGGGRAALVGAYAGYEAVGRIAVDVATGTKACVATKNDPEKDEEREKDLERERERAKTRDAADKQAYEAAEEQKKVDDFERYKDTAMVSPYGDDGGTPITDPTLVRQGSAYFVSESFPEMKREFFKVAGDAAFARMAAPPRARLSDKEIRMEYGQYASLKAVA